MKLNFTQRIRRFSVLVTSTLVLLLLIISPSSYAQKWSGEHGNEWIVSGQDYVKLTVSHEGIQKVDALQLPAAFRSAANISKIQLWHRGKQVALLQADAAEILFYGILNDGKSDELLYRPNPAARINKLVSLFSDKSAYFLTIGASNGDRAVTLNQNAIANPSSVESDHLYTENRVFMNTSSHDPSDASVKPAYINSFYEEGRSLTGSKLSAASVLQTQNAANSKFNFTVRNVAEGDIKPRLKVLIAGRSEAGRSITVNIVNSQGTVIRTAANIPFFTKFMTRSAEFDLEPGDFPSGVGYLGFQGSANNDADLFSVSYYSVTYPQTFDMNGLNSYKFLLNSPTESTSQLQVSNLPSGTVKLYDITDVRAVKIIKGNASDFKVTRTVGSTLNILATTESYTPTVETVKLSVISKVPDFLIVSTSNLYEVAKEYGDFRGSTLSAKATRYKPVTYKIEDIYNLFNFGEPSPVAIKRFVDYMISGTDKDKYLLLVGKSVSYEGDMVRELPDNVPTIGYPGSDELLVDGLGNVPENVPAIPYGRIPALTEAHVNTYREKAEEYEFGQSLSNFSWRNKVIHVNGGTSELQANTFKAKLASLAATNVSSPRSVSAYFKIAPYAATDQAVTITELKDATTNGGAGIITFFGHGTTYRTDKNISYVSDPAKGYLGTKKYSGMFYFGCDVNNIFRNRFAETPYNSRARPVGLDWLFTPDKGAITVFANSWDGYESAFIPYMDLLYPRLFVADSQKRTIGKLIKEVAEIIVSTSGGRVSADYVSYVANIHQGVLLGDPATKLLYTLPSAPLPIKLISFTGEKFNETVKLSWATAWEKDNSHFGIERSFDGKNFENIGQVEGKGTISDESKYTYYDSNPLSGVNYYRLVQHDLPESATTESGMYSRIIAVKMPDFENLFIAPNPVLSKFEIKGKSQTDVKSWNIIDIKGETIKTHGSGNIVDMSTYVPGVYVIEAVTSNGVIRKKIVKQ